MKSKTRATAVKTRTQRASTQGKKRESKSTRNARRDSQDQLISLLCALAETANEAGSPQEAMRSSLRLICEHTGWALGRLVTFADPPSKRTPLLALWHVAQSG